jgi:hypothetical protein
MRADDTDMDIKEVFSRLLPHYFDRADDLPADIRLILHLNRWASVPAACIDCTQRVAGKRLARQMARELTHMQSFGRPECAT